MKVLRLGTSDDAFGDIPDERRSHRIAERMLAEASGEEVETIVRRAWPTAEFPAAVERFMERYEPDMVVLQVPAFWFAYESVPLKLERLFGRIGRPFARAGLKAAGISWLAYNPVFATGRRLAQLTIGGATYFEPEEVVESLGQALRSIVRREECAVAVSGPQATRAYHSSDRARRRAEARRQHVHLALRSLCDELHVYYSGSDTPAYRERRHAALKDRLHSDEEGHEEQGERLAEIMVAGWRMGRGAESETTTEKTRLP